MRQRINAIIDTYGVGILLTISLLLVVAGVYSYHKLHNPVALALPILLPVVLLLIYDYRLVFWLLIASVPLSLPTELPGGLATDLVSEQIMWGLLLVTVLLALGGKLVPKNLTLSPFLILIGVILFWALITSLTSEIPMRSYKYWLSKLWYIAATVVIGLKAIRSPKDIRNLARIYLASMSLVIVYGFIRHALDGFSLENSNRVLYPFYMNHVVYAASAAIGVPLAWYGRLWYAPRSLGRLLMSIALMMMFLGVTHALARGAWVAIFALPFVYLLFKTKLFERAIYLGLILVTFGIIFILNDNYYFRFAPDYKNTIYHGTDISAHLESTFDGTDLSGMERVNRWVAAKNMIATRPIVGFGPSTFAKVYKGYGESNFRTYVSENLEESTTHNYFLMVFSEQGFIGGLLFIGFCVYILVVAYRTYWRLHTPAIRGLLLAVTMAFCTILLHLVLNELVETDKIGVPFWVLAVCIHRLNQWSQTANSVEA